MDEPHLAMSGHRAAPGACRRLLDRWFRPRRFETERFYELPFCQAALEVQDGGDYPA
jgi:hypothetical protein